MRRKEMAERLLRMFNIDLPVEYGESYGVVYDFEYGFNTSLEVEGYDVAPTSIREMKLNLAYNTQYKLMNVPVSWHLFAIFHEIGHIMNEDSFDHDEYVEDIESLDALYQTGRIDENTFSELYNLVDAEAAANNWAKNWVMNNLEFAKQLDKELE